MNTLAEKTTDCNSSVNQDIKRRFVDREVIYCVSTLVYELAQKAEHFRDYEDDLYGAFEGLPDYEDAADNEGWIEFDKDKYLSKSGYRFPKWFMDLCDEDVIDDVTFINPDSEEISEAEDWEALCDEQGIDTYEYRQDIYEHWIVSEYLADKLENHGHKVLRDFFGMTVWCRPTSGQAILLDGVISEICSGMGILEGQANDWSK